MKVLAFEIGGDYGHFRKFYTTTSPLTFSFPPPSTIAGILGAIYGASKIDYLELFSLNKCHLAIKIVNPVKKVRMGINLSETKGKNLIRPMSDKSFNPRIPIRTEFLKAPYFTIYFAHQDETVLKELVNLLKEHKSIYTVSLGLSELLADYKYIGIYNAEKASNNLTEVVTPILISNLIADELEIEEGKKYFKEKMPIVMNSERTIEKYENVIFEPNGKTIKANLHTYYKLENGENIAFF